MEVNYQKIFEDVQELLCILDSSGRFLKVNSQWTHIFGFSSIEIISQLLFDFIHPQDVTNSRLAFEALNKDVYGVAEFENRFQSKNGDYIWLSWKVHFVDDQIVATARNVTEQKNQELYYKDIQEAANMGYWRLDLATNTPIWSDTTYDIHGLPRGSKIDLEKAIDFYAPVARPVIAEKVANGIEKAIPWDEELPFIDAKGKHLWVRAIGKPVKEKEKVTHLYGVFQDITEKKSTELRFKYLAESGSDGFWDWWVQEDYEYMSPRFWEILGYAPEEKMHHPSEWQALIFEDDLKVALANFDAHVKSRGKSPFYQEARYRHKDGSTVWVVCQGKVVEWGSEGEPIRMIGSHTDVTPLKKTQSKLVESSKLASLGEMAGGIAHEINNPLGIIAGNIFVIENSVQLKKDGFENKILNATKTIEETVDRISKIIEGMRHLLRNDQNPGQKKEVDFSSTVETTLSFCLERFKAHGIAVRVDIKETAMIHCDVTQFSQTIVNIMGNAFDAVCKTKAPWVEVRSEIKNDRIVLHITDSGQGIPDEIAQRIFEPFFTTKPVGSGTGIGLSISREMMEASGGELYYDDTNANTSFVVAYPIVKQDSKCG